MNKKSKLDDALIVVTGASSGIGEATARAFTARGSRVILIARNAQRLNTVVSDIRSQGGKAEAYATDLANPHGIAAIVPKIVSEHGVPDILVNNAGAGRWLPLKETSAEEAAQMMAVPYLAAFNLTRGFLDGMCRRGSGHIVNVTSVASQLAWPGAVAYTAARRAIEGFTTALRADLRGTGLNVTLAVFGTVESDYWKNNPGSRDRLPQQAAGMRSLTPEEVATAILIGVEKNQRTIVKPAIFRLLFLLNALFPEQTEAMMSQRA